jgi:hypothetical protein
LASILPGQADRPTSQTAELTPTTWANANKQARVSLARAVKRKSGKSLFFFLSLKTFFFLHG